MGELGSYQKKGYLKSTNPVYFNAIKEIEIFKDLMLENIEFKQEEGEYYFYCQCELFEALNKGEFIP
jgi:hypothetical protein